MNRVLILGKDGMLGTMVSSYLTSLKDYEIYLTSRRDEDIDLDDNIRKFDVSNDSLEGLVNDINPDFLINVQLQLLYLHSSMELIFQL